MWKSVGFNIISHDAKNWILKNACSVNYMLECLGSHALFILCLSTWRSRQTGWLQWMHFVLLNEWSVCCDWSLYFYSCICCVVSTCRRSFLPLSIALTKHFMQYHSPSTWLMCSSDKMFYRDTFLLSGIFCCLWLHPQLYCNCHSSFRVKVSVGWANEKKWITQTCELWVHVGLL